MSTGGNAPSGESGQHATFGEAGAPAARGAWEGDGTEWLERMALRELRRYGARPADAIEPELAAIYRSLVRTFDADRRVALLDRLGDAIELGRAPAKSLVPVILLDPDPAVVAAASAMLAALMPDRPGDPRPGLRYLLGLAALHERERVRGGILGGILGLGDRDAVSLVAARWALLDRPTRLEIIQAAPNFPFAAVVDFFLDRLEEAVAERDEALIGALAGKLAGIAQAPTGFAYVVEIERQPAAEVAARWTFAAYGQAIAPRLRLLAAREPSPKVLPAVLRAWTAAG